MFASFGALFGRFGRLTGTESILVGSDILRSEPGGGKDSLQSSGDMSSDFPNDIRGTRVKEAGGDFLFFFVDLFADFCFLEELFEDVTECVELEDVQRVSVDNVVDGKEDTGTRIAGFDCDFVSFINPNFFCDGNWDSFGIDVFRVF